MKIYLASPFFNDEERTVYTEIIKFLRGQKHDVFVPAEHEIENAWDISNECWGEAVFGIDYTAIQKCDVMVVLNWGMYSDTGTAWECGCAFALGKKVINVCVNRNVAEYSLMMVNGCHLSVILETFLAYDFEDILKMSGNTSAEYIEVK